MAQVPTTSPAFIDQLTSARAYDLGTRYEMGMPVHPTHPPYVFTLQRRHGDTFRPGNYSSSNELIVMCGHTGTHIDSLAHVSENGDLFSGIDAADNQQGGLGMKQHGVETIAPVVRRGVLLDVAGAEGVDILPPDFAINAETIQSVANSQGLEIRGGDCVLVRTGWMQHVDDAVAYLDAARGQPGVNADGGEWLAEQGIFLGGSDTAAFEQVVPDAGMPVHLIFLARNGIHILEMANLEELAADKVYEFGFVLSPLKLVGATGSPVRPIALAQQR